MKLYICNKIGQRDTCQISCIHSEPHELIDEEGENGGIYGYRNREEKR